VRRIALLTLCAGLLGGCLSMDETPKESRDIDVAAFVQGRTPGDVRPSTVEVPASEFQPPKADDDSDVTVAPDGVATTTTTRTLRTTNPDGAKATIKDGSTTSEALLAGQRWPVDQLIGQINGKPLYANDFLASRENRILRIVANPDRTAARKDLLRAIDEAFDQFVNNQLVISEAESAIPEEAKEGLLSWMRELQEKEIAKHGGSRSETQRSIEEEFPGVTIEEFMKRQKNEILASDLIQKRVKPRTIVSWRDVERLYLRNWDAFNPPPTLRVGRLAVPKDDAAKVEQVKALFAQGKSFAEVAQSLQAPNDGLWREFKLGAQGIDGVPDLVDDLKVRIKGLKEGAVDGPVERGTQITWMTLLPGQQVVSRSIFEPKLQLQLRRQLEGERFGQEQYRYLKSLKSRWIAEDLTNMKARLLQFTLDRYWR
jgi:hypothetical protein